jgi:ketosteroid isomerase-like protein
MTATSVREDADIRERIDTLAGAIRAKDVDALMAHYAPEVVVFDIRPPARIRGVDAYRKNFEAWFASVKGRIDYEVHDLSIARSGDVAFCCCVSHVRSVRTTDEKPDYWVRVTSGLQKMGGQWLVAHEHISMPIDLQTMQAASGLRA